MTHHVHWALIPVAIGAFLTGSIPFGLLVGRWFYDSDIRFAGSGNIGAANALRTFGRTAGAAVLVLDALKGALPTVLELRIAGGDAAVTAALFTVLGHCYSPWLYFRGGKGVATWLGALFVLSGLAGIAFAVVWVAIVARTRLASLGSLVATIVSAAVLVAVHRRFVALDVVAVLVTVVIFLKHRSNIARLRGGREPRLKFGRGRRPARATGPSGRGG